MKMLWLWPVLGWGAMAVAQGSGAVAIQGEAQSVEVPAGERVMLTAEGRGVQVYRCERTAANVSAWLFVAPQASLSVGNRLVGTHGAGPVWRYEDGSSLAGEVVAEEAAPAAGALPRLLLRAMGHKGNPKGLLATVSFIQRLETVGGMAPAGACEAGASLQVPYSAVYRFYAAADPSATPIGRPQGRR